MDGNDLGLYQNKIPSMVKNVPNTFVNNIIFQLNSIFWYALRMANVNRKGLYVIKSIGNKTS